MKLIEDHYRENYRKLHKMMTFRAGTEWDAEDIIQEAYARALKYIAGFDGLKSFDSWFKTILNNTLRDHKNAEKGYASATFDEEESEGIPCDYYTSRIVAEIDELIDTKSVVQKEVLGYYFKQGYTAKDISCITDYSYSNTHQIIQRFRNELKELYR